MTQEQEARAYNRAFLHGKEVGLAFGRRIAIDEVLEIIDVLTAYFNGDTWVNKMDLIAAIERMKGEQA